MHIEGSDIAQQPLNTPQPVFETKHVWTWGGLEPPIIGFMPNVLTIWAIGLDIRWVMFVNTESGGIDIFVLYIKTSLLATYPNINGE